MFKKIEESAPSATMFQKSFGISKECKDIDVPPVVQYFNQKEEQSRS
jgi:hypothetical protein